MRTYRRRSIRPGDDDRVEANGWRITLVVERCMTQDGDRYGISWRRQGVARTSMWVSPEYIEDLLGADINAEDWAGLAREVGWCHLPEALALRYYEGPSWVPAVADQANVELEQAKREDRAREIEQRARERSESYRSNRALELEQQLREVERRMLAEGRAVAADPELGPGDVVTDRRDVALPVRRMTIEHVWENGIACVVWFSDGMALRGLRPLEDLVLAPPEASKPAPAIAETTRSSMTETLGGLAHLADRVPGKAGRRAACGRTPNGRLLEYADFNRELAFCADCNRILQGRESELRGGRSASAVASAPAARPRLTVACQSQYDPDDG